MINRALLVGAAAFVLSASSSSAQGQQQKHVVISKAVLKSMAASKPKTKSPLGARAGIVRRTNAVTVEPKKGAPTSVRSVGQISGRK